MSVFQSVIILFKIGFIFRKRGREKEGEKHQCARETLISCLWHAPN